MNSNLENNTRELLKNSLLVVPDDDFSNRVMERIHLEAQQKKTILSSISKAWIFTFLSLMIAPFGLSEIVKNFQPISILNIDHLMIDSTGLSIILSTFLAIVILLILDSLIRLTISRKQHLYF